MAIKKRDIGLDLNPHLLLSQPSAEAIDHSGSALTVTTSATFIAMSFVFLLIGSVMITRQHKIRKKTSKQLSFDCFRSGL
jgi:uncharacterized membrane protein YozB (DUF420 family)